jgi:hypothetical protein
MTEPANNPYGAPASQVDDRGPEGFSGTVALLAGCAGYGAAFTLGSLLSPLWQHWLIGSGVPIERLYDEFGGSLPVNLVSQLLTALAGVLAGYLAARYSRGVPLLHAAAATIPIYIIALASHLGVYPSPFPLWSNVLSVLLPLPCALVGAGLWRRSTRKA